MKAFKISHLGLLLIAVCIFACTKDKSKPQATINTIISPAQLDKLKENGTIINDGTNPPNIQGIFLLHPDVCSFDNSAEGLKGQKFNDYYYEFTNQLFANANGTPNQVSLNFSNTDRSANDFGGDTIARPVSVSGNANLFTVIAQNTGVEYGVTYTSVDIISGETITATPGGPATAIKNLQVTKSLLKKGADPNSILTEVGTTRIFYDANNLSEKVTDVIVDGVIRNSEQLKSGTHAMHLARRIPQ